METTKTLTALATVLCIAGGMASVFAQDDQGSVAGSCASLDGEDTAPDGAGSEERGR